MQMEQSRWLAEMREPLGELLSRLTAVYPYASILAEDKAGKRYTCSAAGQEITRGSFLNARGIVVRVHDGHGFLEYASDHFTGAQIPEVLETIAQMCPAAGEDPVPAETPLAMERSTEFAEDIRLISDREILETLEALRQEGLGMDPEVAEVYVMAEYQTVHKLFLSRERELAEHRLWCDGMTGVYAQRGDTRRSLFRGLSGVGGWEVFSGFSGLLPELVQDAKLLLDAEPVPPGEYTCICTPEVSGIIAHESFGHGVELDMFVKDRAKARAYMGKPVASPLITMHDSGIHRDTGFAFFDDEGNLTGDTVIIDQGILVSGMSDALSALRLGVNATGNGRRESFSHKAYARMTNTWFEAGQSTLEEMIAATEDGLLLGYISSGMEDPRGWGIQCIVSMAKEIKHGRLTGRVFSPSVLTGYVPELLGNVDMVGDRVEFSGCNGCGKGYKEFIKVSIGGPYLRTKIRLG